MHGEGVALQSREISKIDIEAHRTAEVIGVDELEVLGDPNDVVETKRQAQQCQPGRLHLSSEIRASLRYVGVRHRDEQLGEHIRVPFIAAIVFLAHAHHQFNPARKHLGD